MAKNKRKVITRSKEIYEKFNQLHFTSEVILSSVKKRQVDRILKNINGNGNILVSKVIGKYIVVKKKNPLNFNIYLK